MTNTLYDALFAPLAGRDRPFLIRPDGMAMSGAAFLALVQEFAGRIVAAGLRPGDRMAVQVAKSPEALALYGAAVAAGVIFLPLNTAYTPEEVEYFVGDAGARLLIGDPTRALAPIAACHGARYETLAADGSGSFASLPPAPFAVAPRAPGDLAAFLYTSGTTGRSKGAMLSHANLLSNAEVLVREWRFTDQDVLIHALPIFHTHGLFVASNVMLLSGGTMIFLPGFDAAEVRRWLPRATSLMGVPTFYTRLLDQGLTREEAAGIRLFVSGSAPLLAETHRDFEARTGQRILERYGMTETNMNTSNPYAGDRRAGTVGLPLPGVELRILVEGREAAPGEPGLIEVRGPNVFQGYWNMPEKTAEELRPDGFFLTGDIGERDAEGYITIVGRAKDVIITGGYNVYPKEIELLLDEAEGVLESAVFGVPDADFGEKVVGVVVPRPGSAPDPAALLAGLEGRLARFKQPRALRILPELPRNAMGKVQKALLRQGWAE